MKNNDKIDWAKLLAQPAEIDGVRVSDSTLAEFLDWSFATGSKDFSQFQHLKKTGYFKEHPVTAEMLNEAAVKKINRKTH